MLLSLVLEVLAIASPFFLQLVVDRVVVGRDRDLLAVLGIGFALLAATIAVITALRSWLGVYISTRLNLQLLDTLFARLLRLPPYSEAPSATSFRASVRSMRSAHADADLPETGWTPSWSSSLSSHVLISTLTLVVIRGGLRAAALGDV
jgi:ABC-type protease/lipase transport system fused ATPase/permease subunit